MTYEATLVVQGLDLDDEGQMEFLEERPYVALPAETEGRTEVELEIGAPTALDAWAIAVRDLQLIGVSVRRIGLDLVGTSEIALRLDVNRETVRLWAAGRRRDGFPVPYGQVSRSSVWRWADVAVWACEQEELRHLVEYTPFPSDMVDALNGARAHARQSVQEGWLRPHRGDVVPIHRGASRRLGRAAAAAVWSDLEQVRA